LTKQNYKPISGISAARFRAWVQTNKTMKKKIELLNQGAIIKKGDQYYNPRLDKWRPVESEFIGNEFYIDESKPVRRITTELKA